VKKLKYFSLAFLVASLLAIPAAAQGKKGTRNNNGANEPHGLARADEVQDENHQPSKGSKRKSQGKKTREGWEGKRHHGRNK